MFNAIRNHLRHRRTARELARLDPRLRADIGLPPLPSEDVLDPVLLMQRGPFDRHAR